MIDLGAPNPVVRPDMDLNANVDVDPDEAAAAARAREVAVARGYDEQDAQEMVDIAIRRYKRTKPKEATADAGP